MIEATINGIQMVLAGICAGVCIGKAFRTGRRSWLLLVLFFGAFFFGDLYWQLFLLFYDDTPHFSYTSELNWYSSYLFLLLLVLHLQEDSGKMKAGPGMWLIPLFTGGMCIFYMQWGDYPGNLITAVLMTLLLWYSVKGLRALKAGGAAEAGARAVYRLTILFCLVEYCLWTISCFWMGHTARNPYFWFDLLLALLLPLFPAALGKEAEE